MKCRSIGKGGNTMRFLIKDVRKRAVSGSDKVLKSILLSAFMC